MTSQPVLSTNRIAEKTGTVALLVFKVENQLYGLPVTHVVRIIEMVTITALPGAPDLIEGIINFHGKAVPIMPLRRRFNLQPVSYGLHTPIILVDLISHDHILGLVVDTVEDVLEVPVNGLDLTETIVPDELVAHMASQAAYLAGVAKVDQRFIIVLNVQSLLSSTAQGQLTQLLGMKDK
jgi:purine-binding chemotaxis protein CheW